MTEFVNEVSLEEQQEKVAVLQSIFENDLQIIHGENWSGNIRFDSIFLVLTKRSAASGDENGCVRRFIS